ncbi:helix-turn-helix domain-containing protein [Nocardia transvalensis]|uniref:helix-turn-helix domain-containing protein n=1 Tax=Nocardia transvalensis TaxID=37333 RepID=UPI0018952498|nr:helix-turn-helix transcriptional regulator [Nocardia transvalensis]MBF6334121.1 helix-turn-helix domain-containing protein [Nocardia transvalensis]
MSGPTVSSRALGKQLQKYRKRAGLSEYAVSKAAETSAQTYGRLEDGLKHNVTNMMINAICDRLQVSNDERRLLLVLAEEVRRERASSGKWWRAQADEISPEFNRYLHLEESARRLTMWNLALMPGLLQTTEYRREIAWAEKPSWTPEEVERSIALMIRRQERLSDPDFEVEAILSEALLRYRIGNNSIMTDQLLHLLEVGELPNVSIRVVPFAVPNTIGPVADSFVWMDFPQLESTKLQQPPVVYVEELVGGLYLEREVEIAQYRDALPRIRRIALGENETRNLILATAREYSE